MLALIAHYGAKKGARIADAYDSLREDLRAYPNLVPPEANGRTHVLHRAELLWIYEVLTDRIRLLNVLDPRRDIRQ